MISGMDERAAVAEEFVGARAEDFPTSPLYRALRPVVAEQPEILDMLGHRWAGQQAPYLFFGAVHYLVLGGAEHPLRDFFASVVKDAARSPEEAGPALIDFCDTYRPELNQLIRTRLVQTNSVRRAVGLRYALAVIAQSCNQPVHLVEVGASAGTLLHVDRYRFRIGARSFGPADAPVAIDSDWRGNGPVPDLSIIPAIASRTGVDLHPVDVTRPHERAWLRALVWPESFADAGLLDAALTSLAADPPRLIAGDGIDVCPDLGRQLPSGEPRVVFHAATRMHVPPDRRAAFDQAIDSMGEHGPLFHVWLEPGHVPHEGDTADDRRVLRFHGPGTGGTQPLVQIAGHGQWLAPVDAELGGGA